MENAEVVLKSTLEFLQKHGLEVNNISLKNIKSVDNFIQTKISSQSLKKLNETNFKKKYS